MPPLDVTRYRLDPPPQAQRNDYTAWQAALDNAHSQLEHQLNRITNLELLLKYGPNTWRAQTQLDEVWLAARVGNSERSCRQTWVLVSCESYNQICGKESSCCSSNSAVVVVEVTGRWL